MERLTIAEASMSQPASMVRSRNKFKGDEMCLVCVCECVCVKEYECVYECIMYNLEIYL